MLTDPIADMLARIRNGNANGRVVGIDHRHAQHGHALDDQRLGRLDLRRADGAAPASRGLEHLARLARVADDEHPWALAGDLGRGGTTERQGEVRGEDLACDSAYAVGPEELPGQRAP